MSNFPKDHPSIRVIAAAGGRSNIFGVPEPEPPLFAKKNHMESDIFGCKKDSTDSVPVKQTRNVTNNIYGNQPEQTVQKSNMYSGKNKSTIFDEPLPQERSIKPDRQRSDIFGTNDPVQSAPARATSEKFKSNIFGVGDNDTQSKRQQGTRQGLRGKFEATNKQDSYRPSIAISLYSPLRLKDPNASRMGYNPINGESYSTKDGLNSKIEHLEIKDNGTESDDTVKTPDEEVIREQGENGNGNKANGSTTENGNSHASTDVVKNGNGQSHTDSEENGNTQTPVDTPTNGHNTAKNQPANVRVCHPPGGRSNGPLW